MRGTRARALLLLGLLVAALAGARPVRAGDSLFEAVLWGNLEEVERVLDADPSRIRTRFGGGYGLLHVAVRGTSLELVETLLERGADVDARADDGRTPLHEAAQVGETLFTLRLLFARASPNLADEDGLTPLHLAVKMRNLPTVRILVFKGAKTGLRDRKGRTPLDLARLAGPREIFEFLATAAPGP